MESHVTVEPLSTVPADACVSHVDELDGKVQQRFLELVDSGPAVPESSLPEAFAELDVVKFTSYYRVEGAYSSH